MKLWAAFYLGFVPLLLFPSWPIAYLAPFAVLCFYSNSLLRSLWIAAGLGMLVDIFAGDGPLGLCAASYALATLLLYRRRHTFYEQQLPLLTILFSCLSTGFAALILAFTRGPFRISLSWIVTDLLLLPCFDGLYALVWFTLPLWVLFGRPGRPRPYVQRRPR